MSWEKYCSFLRVYYVFIAVLISDVRLLLLIYDTEGFFFTFLMEITFFFFSHKWEITDSVPSKYVSKGNNVFEGLSFHKGMHMDHRFNLEIWTKLILCRVVRFFMIC